MIFNRSYQRNFLGFAVLAVSIIATGSLESDARAEPRPETFRPSGPTLAGNQLRFEQGVEAYDAGDHATAYAIWLPLAKAGDLAAQRNVAHLLRNGLGTETDMIRALFFYERAARSGLTSAALNAGMMRLDQDAEFFDPEKAAEWLAMAAAAGSPIAQWELSRLLESGEAGREDPEAARLLLQHAAASGHEEATARLQELNQPSEPLEEVTPIGRPPAPARTPPPPAKPLNIAKPSEPATPREVVEPIIPQTGQAAPVSPELGAAYMTGVFQHDAGDYSAAAETWKPLAEQGVIEAQYRLGRLYQFGMGVSHDVGQARHWFTLADAAGHPQARDALKALPALP
jgi:uncharacterized protein